jgi:hypothetical protein
MCARREAQEEVGRDIEILPASVTWYLPQQGPVQQVEVRDRPRPFALYEMIHPADTPRAGQLYRIVIFKARLRGAPRDLPPDEVLGVIALTEAQVAQGLARKPRLVELLDEGAALVAGEERIDSQVRLYPLGTARALARLLRQIGKAQAKLVGG